MKLNIKQNCFAHIIFLIVWSYIFFRNLISNTFILANLYRRHNYSFILYAPNLIIHSLNYTPSITKTKTICQTPLKIDDFPLFLHYLLKKIGMSASMIRITRKLSLLIEYTDNNTTISSVKWNILWAHKSFPEQFVICALYVQCTAQHSTVHSLSTALQCVCHRYAVNFYY